MPLTLKNFYALVPLNPISDLTVVGGDTEATITWTDPVDLASTTWVSTKLVRKVGSAPADSTDGTLVVTETVRDTYSVSGYNDTGLTNGTTYYYAAFAVGNNGLETISSTTPNVTPAQGGWTPGVNTLCYYTFDNTLADASGNHANASNMSSCTFTAAYTGSTKQVLNKPNGSYIKLPSTFLQTAASTYTMLFWFKSSQSGAVWLMGCNTSSDYDGNVMADVDRTGFGFLYGRTFANRRQAVNTSTYRDGNWHLLSIRRGTGDVIMGVDINFTTTYHINATSDYSIGGNGINWGIGTRSTSSGDINTSSIFQLGDFITEDKYWTDQEISDYYNQTCEYYGLQPITPWQPGANTLLYLPLNGDITDPYNQVTYNWVGTSSFATWSTGVQAANFTGSNAINLGASTDFEQGTGEMTVLFWFTSNLSGQQRCEFHNNGKYFMGVRTNSSKLGFYCRNSSSADQWEDGTTTLTSGTKYLAALTMKENGQAILYLNGNVEKTINIGTFKTSTFQFGQHIGAGREGGSEFWIGMIKDFIIENRERTVDEITNYYNQTK